MTFKPNVRLDPRQVRDLRGRRMGGLGGGGLGGLGGGGGGIPIPMGGGLVGILVLIVIVVLASGILDGGQGGLSQYPMDDARANESINEECKTGEDANRREDCRIVGFVNSIQAYWEDEFSQSGSTYTPATTVLFTDYVQTGCGQASSAVGPFYCPNDQRVYLDLGFFAELSSRFGAQGGPLAQAYVLAHEYGHHIQNVTGTLSQASQGSGPESGAVRVELQADCYAGVWTGNAVNTEYLEPLGQSEIAQALDAAAAVGDDRIQQRTQGRVMPEKFTHGTSEQRQNWFGTGYRQADPDSCDTFSGAI
jgi:uncharacterized protein